MGIAQSTFHDPDEFLSSGGERGSHSSNQSRFMKLCETNLGNAEKKGYPRAFILDAIQKFLDSGKVDLHFNNDHITNEKMVNDDVVRLLMRNGGVLQPANAVAHNRPLDIIMNALTAASTLAPLLYNTLITFVIDDAKFLPIAEYLHAVRHVPFPPDILANHYHEMSRVQSDFFLRRGAQVWPTAHLASYRNQDDLGLDWHLFDMKMDVIRKFVLQDPTGRDFAAFKALYDHDVVPNESKIGGDDIYHAHVLAYNSGVLYEHVQRIPDRLLLIERKYGAQFSDNLTSLLRLISSTSRCAPKDMQQYLLKLPSIPREDLDKSHNAVAQVTSELHFDFHDDKLNFLGAHKLSDPARRDFLALVDKVQDFYQVQSPLSKEAYVFRGLQLFDLEDTVKSINLDSDSIIFATPDLSTALHYALRLDDRRDDDATKSILQVIRLLPGLPVISTNQSIKTEDALHRDEIVLPRNTQMRLDSTCIVPSWGNRNTPIPLLFQFVTLLPTKRKRLISYS